MTLLCLLFVAQDLDAALSSAVKDAVAKVRPSVVRIDLVGGREDRTTATTGVVVGSDGLIATSAFGLASKPNGVVVRLSNGENKSGRLLGVDRVLAVALIRIDAGGLPTALPAAKSATRVGQYAVAVGRTLADEPSASLGVISALGRVWGKAVQTDAKVSPVNYGGPLVNLAGEVVGVLAPLSPQSEDESAGVEFYDSGVGFAVPLPDVLAVLPRLRNGDLPRGRLGLGWEQENLLAEPLSVERLAWRSPAANAGLRKGDRIVSVDGKPIRRLSEFRHAVGRTYAGDRLTVEYERGRAKTRVAMTAVETLPVYRMPFLGIAFADRTANSPVVARVWPGSPAESAKIAVGEVLERLDGGAVRDRAGALRALEQKSAGEEFSAVVVGQAGARTVKLKSASFPESLPKSAALAAGPAPKLAEFQQPLPHWSLTPPTKPKWLVIWQGEKPSDGWKTICAKANAALVGVGRTSAPFALHAVAGAVQKRLGVTPARTIVVGPGRQASQFAESAKELATGAVFLDGPFAISARQPGDRQLYLAFSRKLGAPIVEAVTEARANGAPIAVAEFVDDAGAADAVSSWLTLLESL